MLAIASCSAARGSALVDGVGERRAVDVDREDRLAAAGNRNEGLALAAKERASDDGVGVGLARSRPVRAAARRVLVQARIGADRPDEAFPAVVAGDEPRQRCAGRDEQLVVGDRRVDLGEMAADLLFGRPARRQADREPRDRRARAVDERRSPLRRRARARRSAGARRAGRRGRRRSTRRRRRRACCGVESPAEPRRLASGSCRAASSSRGRCPGSARRFVGEGAKQRRLVDCRRRQQRLVGEAAEHRDLLAQVRGRRARSA